MDEKITTCHHAERLVHGLVVRWCYGFLVTGITQCRQSSTMVFGSCMCAGAPRKAGPGTPAPCPDTPGAPQVTSRLATAGWSNPPEQRARTGVSQFVSDAQSVWPGVRTECPHRRRAPEGWQHPRG